MLNKNRNRSRYSSLIPICKNAFLRSANKRWVDIRARIMMSHNRGCKGGPVCIHSLTLLARGWGLALASKTMPSSLLAISFVLLSLWPLLSPLWRLLSPLVYKACRRRGDLWTALVLSRLCPLLVALVLFSHSRFSGLRFSRVFARHSRGVFYSRLAISFVLDSSAPGTHGTPTLCCPSLLFTMFSRNSEHTSS